MRVLLICNDDYANFQYDMWQSLLSVGVECDAFKLVNHPFGYDNQCPIITIPSLLKIQGDYDYVIVTHSDTSFIEYFDKNKVIPFHTGTFYRRDFVRINECFKDSPITLIALPEFQLMATNYKYVIGSVDIDLPIKDLGERLVVGHFPSNETVKGTERILNVLKDLEGDFDLLYSKERVSHAEQLERLNKCDIYIEMLAPLQDGKPYGSFGITALEAASLGKIVITQSINDNGLYPSEYGVSMLNLVKNEQDLKKVLSGLLNYKGDFIRGQQELTRQWVKDKHSHKATGERLKRILNGLQTETN